MLYNSLSLHCWRSYINVQSNNVLLLFIYIIGATLLEQHYWSNIIGATLLEQHYWSNIIGPTLLEQYYWSNIIGAILLGRRMEGETHHLLEFQYSLFKIIIMAVGCLPLHMRNCNSLQQPSVAFPLCVIVIVTTAVGCLPLRMRNCNSLQQPSVAFPFTCVIVIRYNNRRLPSPSHA